MFGALIEFAIICTVADVKKKKTEKSTSNADSTRDLSTVRARGLNIISLGISGEPRSESEVTVNFILFLFYLTLP